MHCLPYLHISTESLTKKRERKGLKYSYTIIQFP
jgi:hypothetical protein